MNKEKFNKLKIEDQVKHLNLEIKTKEFEKVCKSVGSNKPAMIKKLKNNGYVLNATKKKIEVYKQVPNIHKAETQDKSKEHKSDINIHEPKEIVVHKDVTKIHPKTQKNIIEVSDAKDRIFEMLMWYESKHKNVIEIPALNIEKSKFESEIVTRAFRLHKKVLDWFMTLAEDYPQYKQQDLMSQALFEFVERYRK